MKGEKMLLSARNVRRGMRLLVAAAFAIAATVAGASPANAVGGSQAAKDERLIRLAPHNITLPKLGESRTYTVTVTNISGETLRMNTIDVSGYNIRVDSNYEGCMEDVSYLLGARDACSYTMTLTPAIAGPVTARFCVTAVTEASTPVVDQECGTIGGKAH
jgi:hypothetical protein